MNLANRVSRMMPAPPAVVFLFWLMVVPGIHQPQLLNGDGDPARHLSHGLWILDHGTLVHNDPFSYTMEGEEFTGFEYGTQLLFAGVYKAAGLAGVSALAVLLIALTPALVCWFLLRRGVDPLLALLGAMLAGLVSQIHFVARPHLVTFLFTVILLDWLERERPPPWWAFGLLFSLWVNLHGGALFGIVLVGLYFVASVLGVFSPTERAKAQGEAGTFGSILIVGVIALFLTPYGASIPLHLIDFFGDPYLRDQTAEFFSPDFHWLGLKPFLAVLIGAMAGFAWSRKRTPGRWILVICATVGFALLAQRNVALFALTGLPLVFLNFDEPWRRLPTLGRIRGGFAAGAAVARNGFWFFSGVVALCLVALNGGTVFGARVLDDEFDPSTFPVEVVEDARSDGLTGRVFHEFTWGGWLLYAWPEQKVFIDGGTDFYGGDLLRTFISIHSMRPGWRGQIEEYEIQHALLSVDNPLAHELSREPGWGLVTCNATGALLSRSVEKTGEEASTLEACLRERTGPEKPEESER